MWMLDIQNSNKIRKMVEKEKIRYVRPSAKHRAQVYLRYFHNEPCLVGSSKFRGSNAVLRCIYSLLKWKHFKMLLITTYTPTEFT